MNENLKCPYCKKELIHIRYILEEIIDNLNLLVDINNNNTTAKMEKLNE